MKTPLLSAATAAMLVAATGASALTYNWSFEATTGTSLGTVSGTISGLEIGSNDGTGLTVEVLSSPSGNVLGGGWSFQGKGTAIDAFTVADDKTVTFAAADFRRDGNSDALFFGRFSDFVPQLFSGNEFDIGEFNTDHRGFAPTVFELVDTTPVPVPAALPLLLAGLGALGIAGRRRRS